ncbi:MAG TPA: cupredoxin domain-containing protein [Candidatus Angelobacter sp.]|nr:cupredoxin domain-containing protein [Candidatus Angelobacter sp.]
MRTPRQSLTLLLSIIFCAACAFAGSPNTAQADQNVQTIEVTAKKYEFNPSPIHVKQGTTVRLKITSLDRAHGIKIATYPDGAPAKGDPGITFTTKQDCFKFDKNSPVTVEFVAHTPGTYTLKCCVRCGLGHGHMKGKLIVEP